MSEYLKRFLFFLSINFLVFACVRGVRAYDHQNRIVPFDNPGEHHLHDCTDMKPVEKADDGSLGFTCLDEKNKMHEFVYRLQKRSCTFASIDIKTGYQHYNCVELFELMARPKKDLPLIQ